MAVLTFAGRHPKGGLPVNAALASSSPRTNGIVNVRYLGWQWETWGDREAKGGVWGLNSRRWEEKGAWERQPAKRASNCYGELWYPGRSKLTGLLPSLHSDVQLW